MQFSELYGTELTTELGSTDTTQRFTTVLRKRYVNEGQRVFNEQTGCFVRRALVALVDETGEYDVESTGVITGGDFVRVAKTGASIKRVDANGIVSYIEGDAFAFITEEELNQTQPGWRSVDPATPSTWYLREQDGSLYVGLSPAPDIPSGETWTLLWPYVAQPADMSADADEPYSVSSNPRTTLRPYHRGIVHYAAAQLEKLRKNYEGSDRQMKLFGAYVARYVADQAPPRGTQVRLAVNYRSRLRSVTATNPLATP